MGLGGGTKITKIGEEFENIGSGGDERVDRGRRHQFFGVAGYVAKWFNVQVRRPYLPR